MLIQMAQLKSVCVYIFPTDVLSDGHAVGDSVWRQIPIGQFQFFISALDDVGHFN